MRDGEIVVRRAQRPRRSAVRMSRFRDLLGVAWTGLTARKIRTLLIMLGPIVGVAAMVGAVGLTESAKGDLKAKLAVARHQPDHRPGGRHVRLSRTRRSPTTRCTAWRPCSPSTGGRGHAEICRVWSRSPTQGRQRLLPGVPGSGARRRPRPAERARGADGRRALAERRRHQAARRARSCSAPGSRSSTAYLRGRDPHDQAQRHRTTASSACSAASRSIPTSTTRCSSRSGPRSTTSRPTGKPNQALRPLGRRRRRRRPPTRSRPRSTSAVPTQVSTKVPSDVLQAVGAGRQDAAADRAVRGPARARRRRARHRERHVDLGDPTIVGDRHPARGRPQPLEDRAAVPARVAVRRHPRRAPRRRARGRRSCISSPRSRTGSS